MESTQEIGGSKFYLKLGKMFKSIGSAFNSRGDKFVKRGSKTIISNPECRLIGPFALKLNFTVDGKDKYQLIVEGDYRQKYKDFGTDEAPIGVGEMFLIIMQKQAKWFLKK